MKLGKLFWVGVAIQVGVLVTVMIFKQDLTLGYKEDFKMSLHWVFLIISMVLILYDQVWKHRRKK